MHVFTLRSGFGRATFATALLAFLLATAGCAVGQRPAEVTPRTEQAAETAGAESPGEPETGLYDETTDAESAAVAEGDAEPIGDEVAAFDEAHDLTEDEALPGEEVTVSPLDELGEVAAEYDPTDVEAPIEPVEAIEPVFDIPIVTNDKVLFWLDYYGTRRHDSFKTGLVRSGRFIPMFRRIFEEAGLPQDLVYMAHVESAYKTTAYSKAHARGIFQFIAATGKRYGLRIDYWADDRLDPEKSAHAAAAYLTDLYEEFGDWYLAMAAYNAGEGRIRRAIARSGSRDFWTIARSKHIHRETKNYVPAIIAATMISKRPADYGFEFIGDTPVLSETMEVEGAADLQVLARCAGTDLETMKQLNPALRRYQTPPHATTIVRVPVGSGEMALAALAEIPVNERVLYVRHVVRSGDTLSALSRRYGVTVSAIQQANRMGRSTMIRVGRELTIPSVAAGSYPAGSAVAEVDSIRGETTTYRVRRGDTLSTIARRHGTSAQAIAAASGIGVQSLLRIGQRLTVVSGVSSASEARAMAGGTSAPATTATAMHVVRRGESLSSIAKRYRTTPRAIAAVNGIRVNSLLQIGQRLKIGTYVTDASASNGKIVHTVRRGDSLSTIASRYRTTVASLCALNDISRGTTLYPGTQLTVALD